MKKPSFQFYPGDWRKDQNLSRASLQAKGAMIEIMCLAFECDKRGILATDGHPWSIDEIAHAMGGDKMVNISAIEELLKLNVLKKNKKNFIFSSRMVKDSKVLDARKKGGELGKDHGVKGKEFGKLGGRPVKKPPLYPPPSSSTSSSTSVKRQSAPDFEDPFFQMFRRASGARITNEELVEEIGKFRNKYPNLHANQAGPLINGWVSRIGHQQFVPEEKPRIVV
jgi:hypothetical protein